MWTHCIMLDCGRTRLVVLCTVWLNPYGGSQKRMHLDARTAACSTVDAQGLCGFAAVWLNPCVWLRSRTNSGELWTVCCFAPCG